MKRFVSLLCVVFLAMFWRRSEAGDGHRGGGGGGGHYDDAVADGHHTEMDEEGKHSIHALDARVHAEQHKRERNYEDEYGNRDHLMDSAGRKRGILKAFDAHSAYGRHLVKDKYFGKQNHGSHYDGAFKGLGDGDGLSLGLRRGFKFGSDQGLGGQSFARGVYGREGFGHSGFAHGGGGLGHLGSGGAGGFGHTVLGHVLLGHRQYGHH